MNDKSSAITNPDSEITPEHSAPRPQPTANRQSVRESVSVKIAEGPRSLSVSALSRWRQLLLIITRRNTKGMPGISNQTDGRTDGRTDAAAAAAADMARPNLWTAGRGGKRRRRRRRRRRRQRRLPRREVGMTDRDRYYRHLSGVLLAQSAYM